MEDAGKAVLETVTVDDCVIFEVFGCIESVVVFNVEDAIEVFVADGLLICVVATLSDDVVFSVLEVVGIVEGDGDGKVDGDGDEGIFVDDFTVVLSVFKLVNVCFAVVVDVAGMDTGFEDCVGAVEAFEVVVVEEGTVDFKVVDVTFGLLFWVVSGNLDVVKGFCVEDCVEDDFIVAEDDDTTTVLVFVVSLMLGVVKCVETILSGIVVGREVTTSSEVC
uniref:Uncharacterized protein n=1 Tax=Panagrolaimus sp. ES5 TaxID=591445 RepID=A0AC34G1G6_9BILA